MKVVTLTEMPSDVAKAIAEEQERFTASNSATAQEIAKKHLSWCGAMLSGSKSGYSNAHPKNLVVFNGNVCTKTHGKIWYGDIDITLSEAKVIAVAKELGETVYVLREMDARFDNERAPRYENAVYTTES